VVHQRYHQPDFTAALLWLQSTPLGKAQWNIQLILAIEPQLTSRHSVWLQDVNKYFICVYCDCYYKQSHSIPQTYLRLAGLLSFISTCSISLGSLSIHIFYVVKYSYVIGLQLFVFKYMKTYSVIRIWSVLHDVNCYLNTAFSLCPSRQNQPLWNYEDITAKVWSVRSVEQLDMFLQHVLRVFRDSLPHALISERWAQTALQLGLSCSSRHYAGRSLQVYIWNVIHLLHR